jgi:hypothetical protein
MPARVTLFRIAAIAILLLTGAEMVTCELLSPFACELSGGPSTGDRDQDDACVCCCFHVVVRTPFALDPGERAELLAPGPPVLLSSFDSSPIYHPPKA